jgi:HlyD family secretion protein
VSGFFCGPVCFIDRSLAFRVECGFRQSITVKNSENHWLDSKTGSAGPPNKEQSRLHRKPAWVFVVPVLVLLGLTLIFGYAFRDRLLPGVPVEVFVAVGLPEATKDTVGISGSGGESQLLFQASGWIEPDPLPIRVTTLYSGVTRAVHVLEGQAVTNGQPIVSLVDDDIRLAVRKAEARASEAKAVRAALEAELKLAQARQVTASRKEEADEARLAVEDDHLRRLSGLKEGTVPEQERVQAELQQKQQIAVVAAAAAVVAEWRAEEERIAKQITVQQQLIAVAEVELAEAQLADSRTQIKSPVEGVVLRLLATPGKRLMLNMDRPDASTAAILYEAGKLQSRVDVPLADAGKLVVGQNVRISCSLLPDQKFTGTVTRIVGEADLQRNTLQAKVRIADPDPRLRPEMLCRAEFFGTANGASAPSSSSGTLTVFVPKDVIRNQKGNDAEVWKLSADTRHALRQAVTLAPGERDGHVAVRTGLFPGDRVIVNPPAQLKDGARVRAVEANSTSH